MSLTKLPLGTNNSVMTSLFPPRESLVVTLRLGTGNSRIFCKPTWGRSQFLNFLGAPMNLQRKKCFSSEPLKNLKNQPRPLVRPSSVNFCHKFLYLSHETVLLKIPRHLVMYRCWYIVTQLAWRSSHNYSEHQLNSKTWCIATGSQCCQVVK